MRKWNIPPALAIAICLTLKTFSDWNLPYPQPDKWNFSKWYSDDISVMLTNNPAYFKDKFSARWRFFKENFIMSNGLVNHKRLDESNNVIGTNEAVSEGQGYGMLLALLNNDQGTFNKIFEAANQNMWDNGRKSYFKWTWPSGSQGAATDADLDIALALIFADKLVRQKYWNESSGTNYKTRALEIIRTIRTKMCDGSNYLLPGDNWGGNEPQNPSYYCTAWMKIFNSYCKANSVNDIDYTPVISRCYEVLGKVRHYSKGQVPDWCNTGGSSYGGKSYGMGNDGIRTPYRIAMDALWFNDSRAIAYCKNIKGTLSQYANTNANYLIAQMGQYDENANFIPETYRCNEVGLWMCGALGSMDNSFQKGVFRQKVLFAMQGDYSFFGSPTYSDDKFYFKQATAGLAYAAFAGMFPNVWDDVFTEVNETAPTQKRASNPAIRFSNGTVEYSGIANKVRNVLICTVSGQKRGGIFKRHSVDGAKGVFIPENRLSKGIYIFTVVPEADGRSARPLVARFIVP